MGFFITLFRVYVIKVNFVARAQNEVKNSLKAARMVYDSQLHELSLAFSLLSPADDLQMLKKKMGLDYLYSVDIGRKNSVTSEIARAAFEGESLGGTRIIGADELRMMGEEYYNSARIDIRPTPKARPSKVKVLDKAMAIEYAMPIKDAQGRIAAVMYGGKILNMAFSLVDKVHDLVFENRLYDNKPMGTVTVFQDDIRIATNVLDKDGRRAIGTRVSESVYDTVVRKGKSWVDRAFVVTDWYLTAYEPIKDIKGAIIGILYVGILEKPFGDMTRNVLLSLLAIMLLVVLLAIVLAFILAGAISKPLTGMLDATAKISKGDLRLKIGIDTEIKELNVLAQSFNEMSEKLHERDKSLKVSNEKLAALNKSYLDLIGFVAHELKGILSSTILNAYSVRDGFLGMVNFKQRKALDSITRNLDYFASTIRNFLNLSRIEKQELSLYKRELSLKEDIFDVSLDAFSREASEKKMQLINNIPAQVKINGDIDLLQIVANNLIGNALKYGLKDGTIVLSSTQLDGRIEIEVYNDGRPLSEEEAGKLFRKFSRLDAPETKREKGTGLGLFITKEIIEKHNGSVRVEPRINGNAFIVQIEEGPLS